MSKRPGRVSEPQTIGSYPRLLGDVAFQLDIENHPGMFSMVKCILSILVQQILGRYGDIHPAILSAIQFLWPSFIGSEF
jgi:hypothetical protein